jgi:hypothetical protein
MLTVVVEQKSNENKRVPRITTNNSKAFGQYRNGGMCAGSIHVSPIDECRSPYTGPIDYSQFDRRDDSCVCIHFTGLPISCWGSSSCLLFCLPGSPFGRIHWSDQTDLYVSWLVPCACLAFDRGTINSGVFREYTIKSSQASSTNTVTNPQTVGLLDIIKSGDVEALIAEMERRKSDDFHATLLEVSFSDREWLRMSTIYDACNDENVTLCHSAVGCRLSRPYLNVKKKLWRHLSREERMLWHRLA